MADTQSQVRGYRQLSATEIALMNEVKDMAVKVGELCNRIAKADVNEDMQIDQRWVAIGRTDLQKGFMSLIRGIARPETF